MNLAELLRDKIDSTMQAIATEDGGFRIISGDLTGERLSVDNGFFSVGELTNWGIDTSDMITGTLTANVDAVRILPDRMNPVELSDETIDRIAERVYELIRQRGIE